MSGDAAGSTVTRPHLRRQDYRREGQLIRACRSQRRRQVVRDKDCSRKGTGRNQSGERGQYLGPRIGPGGAQHRRNRLETSTSASTNQNSCRRECGGGSDGRGHLSSPRNHIFYVKPRQSSPIFTEQTLHGPRL